MEQQRRENPGPGDLEEIRRKIDDCSQRLASLYGRSSAINEERVGALEAAGNPSDPVAYERLRERLEPSRLEMGSIALEIKQALQEIGRLREDLRSRLAHGAGGEGLASEVGRGTPQAPSDEVLRLEKRLHEIADTQVESVRLWNENPREEGREAFEARFRQLHQAFHETLAELNDRHAAGEPWP